MFADDHLSSSGKKWFLHTPQERELLQAQQTYGISEYLAEILVNRLSSLEEIPNFINPLIKDFLPDPSLLPDLDCSADLITECLTHNLPIGIWGDYDVDGATSTALLLRYFRLLNHPCKAHIPNRFDEGYGPNIPFLRKFLESGISHVITVDCGSTSYEPLEWAEKNGMKIIIIDHHRVDTVFPKNRGFINPKRPDFKGPLDLQKLCAAGLVFVFLVGLNRHLRQKNFFQSLPEPNLMKMLDLVALATVCDVMPLTAFNRAIVRQGLKVLWNSPTLGLKILSDISNIRETPRSYHLGYILGPRINAGGRIGKSSLGVKLLATNNPQNAYKISLELNAMNRTRQFIESKITDEAYGQASQQLEKKSIFIWGKDWHEGVLGIVAGRIKETFHKPAFVLSFNDVDGKGSARSIPGIDLGELLAQALEKKLITSGGGHAMAGALRLEEKKFPVFQEFVHNFIDAIESYERQAQIFLERCISLEALNDPLLIEALEILEPAGSGNSAPRFLIPQVRFVDVIPFGQGHIKLVCNQGKRNQEIVCFRSILYMLGENFDWKNHMFDCVVSLQIAQFRGKKTMRASLEDIRTSL